MARQECQHRRGAVGNGPRREAEGGRLEPGGRTRTAGRQTARRRTAAGSSGLLRLHSEPFVLPAIGSPSRATHMVYRQYTAHS